MTAQWKFGLAEFLPFRDAKVCERVRNIKKKDICGHPNKNFKIRIIEDTNAFAFSYAMDIVAGIKRALDEGRRHVIILPAPNPYRGDPRLNWPCPSQS